jgi:hypothetical protein
VHYLPHRGHDGHVLGRFVIEYDITSREAHDPLLEFLATHDPRQAGRDRLRRAP